MISNFLKDRKPWEIDLSLGEPRVSLEATLEVHNDLFKSYSLRDDELTYQPYQGNFSLVDELSYKHNVPTNRIVVTCGGKQGLCASVYAAKKLGFITEMFPTQIQQPAWPLLADPFNLNGVPFEFYSDVPNRHAAMHLIVSPNNPNGSITEPKDESLYIHDAVYACEPYYQKPTRKSLDKAFTTIFSFSKEYGITGSRTGYVICQNENIARLISVYVEESTAGTSGFSQGLTAEILQRERKNTKIYEQRIQLVRNKLSACYFQFKHLNTNFKIDLPSTNAPDKHVIFDIEMKSNFDGAFPFLWVKKGKDFDQKMFNDLSIKLMDGAAFGNADFVRINMAAGADSFIEASKRIKEHLYIK